VLRVSLIGHLAANAELRYSQKGNPVVTFRVAVNQTRAGADGERQQSTEWFRVRVMGRQSEYAQRLMKGACVLVFGRMDINHYESREGESRCAYDVWADEIQNFSPRQSGGERPGAVADANAEGMDPGDGELPF
jgi:single-strand DNA-binding protein